MDRASHLAHVADLVDEVIALDQAQAEDLREYLKAVQAGEGTVHLELALSRRQTLRHRLYSDFEQQTVHLSPERIAQAKDAGRKLIAMAGTGPELKDIPRR